MTDQDGPNVDCGLDGHLQSATDQKSPFKDKCGGDEENRTPDPLLARQVLSQLSYAPTLFLRRIATFRRYLLGGPKWT